MGKEARLLEGLQGFIQWPLDVYVFFAYIYIYESL